MHLPATENGGGGRGGSRVCVKNSTLLFHHILSIVRDPHMNAIVNTGSTRIFKILVDSVDATLKSEKTDH